MFCIITCTVLVLLLFFLLVVARYLPRLVFWGYCSPGCKLLHQYNVVASHRLTRFDFLVHYAGEKYAAHLNWLINYNFYHDVLVYMHWFKTAGYSKDFVYSTFFYFRCIQKHNTRAIFYLLDEGTTEVLYSRGFILSLLLRPTPENIPLVIMFARENTLSDALSCFKRVERIMLTKRINDYLISARFELFGAFRQLEEYRMDKNIYRLIFQMGGCAPQTPRC